MGFSTAFFLGGVACGDIGTEFGFEKCGICEKTLQNAVIFGVLPSWPSGFFAPDESCVRLDVFDNFPTLLQFIFDHSLFQNKAGRAFFLFRCFPLSELIQLIKPRGPILPSLVSTHNLLY